MKPEIKSEYKEQIADLFLRGMDGGALEIISPLINNNGMNEFLVGNIDTKERYKVSFKIDEF